MTRITLCFELAMVCNSNISSEAFILIVQVQYTHKKTGLGIVSLSISAILIYVIAIVVGCKLQDVR